MPVKVRQHRRKKPVHTYLWGGRVHKFKFQPGDKVQQIGGMFGRRTGHVIRVFPPRVGIGLRDVGGHEYPLYLIRWDRKEGEVYVPRSTVLDHEIKKIK